MTTRSGLVAEWGVWEAVRVAAFMGSLAAQGAERGWGDRNRSLRRRGGSAMRGRLDGPGGAAGAPVYQTPSGCRRPSPGEWLETPARPGATGEHLAPARRRRRSTPAPGARTGPASRGTVPAARWTAGPGAGRPRVPGGTARA